MGPGSSKHIPKFHQLSQSHHCRKDIIVRDGILSVADYNSTRVGVVVVVVVVVVVFVIVVVVVTSI